MGKALGSPERIEFCWHPDLYASQELSLTEPSRLLAVRRLGVMVLSVSIDETLLEVDVMCLSDAAQHVQARAEASLQG